MCEKHSSEQVKFYCKTDNKFVCSDFVINEHLGHELQAAQPLLIGQKVREAREKSIKTIESFQAESKTIAKKLSRRQTSMDITSVTIDLKKILEVLESESISMNESELGKLASEHVDQCDWLLQMKTILGDFDRSKMTPCTNLDLEQASRD